MSQSKSIRIEDFQNSSFGREYQKYCNNFIFCSKNHDMYLQRYINLHYQLLIRNVNI